MAGGLNLYGFASGDPVNFSDPFGLCLKEDVACWGFVARLRSMQNAPILQHAANPLAATERQVLMVRAANGDLDPEGWNSDGRTSTYAFGRTTNDGRILINGDVGGDTQLTTVAHEAIYHNENTGGLATDPWHTWHNGKTRDVPIVEQLARNGVVARGYIQGLINDKVPGAEDRLKHLLKQEQ